MALQVFVPRAQRHEAVALLEEDQARVVEVGSEAFFAHFEALKGRKRLEIVVAEGDTFAKIARRHGLSVGMLERINHRARPGALSPGDKLVVYAPSTDPEPPRERDDEAAVASAGSAESEEGPVKPALLRVPVAGEPQEPGPDDAGQAGDGPDAEAERPGGAGKSAP
jgi:membrane-bound lytic murein transglycosylase D